MKVTIYYNALSPFHQDELVQLLKAQLAENEVQLRVNGVLTEQEVSSLISRNKDLIGTLYELERYNARADKQAESELRAQRGDAAHEAIIRRQQEEGV